MNVDAISSILHDFTRAHNTAFSLIAARESQLLELAAIVAVELHYRSNGYITTIKSPADDGTFVVKTGICFEYHPVVTTGINCFTVGVASEESRTCIRISCYPRLAGIGRK